MGSSEPPQLPVQLPIQLPPGCNTPVVSFRYEVNPAIALTVLQDLQSGVMRYQSELRQLVQAMQALYTQGPVVNGWLDSSPPHKQANANPSTPNAALFRHADIDDLISYVQSLDTEETAPQATAASDTVPADKTIAQYWLCMLDQSGNVQACPCPTAQVATVSMAIARYQKLKQLTERKQWLERQLQTLVDALNPLRQTLMP
jgi:hypothetical protein